MSAGLQLSLSDVARLAQVRRPVVSMWRIRAAASDLPFPAPLGGVVGEERFDVDSVVEWLETSGRGNNRDVRADAPACSLPAGLSLRDDPRLFEGLTALLCLKVISGVEVGGASPSDVQTIAAVADPTDRLLRRELQQLGSRLGAVAVYADQLADAAFGSALALEGLLDQRFRHGLAPAVKSAVAAPVHDLVTAICHSLSHDCGAEPPRYVDPTGTGGDLLLSVVLADADQAPDVFATHHDTPAARLFLRRLRVHDIHVETVPGALAALGPAVLLAHFPTSGPSAGDGKAVLDAIDEIALSSGDDQRAVVVAPASLLIDRLGNSSLHQLRSHVVRTGRVRAMVRLPAGLVPHRSRQALALWVLGPDLTGHSLDERRIAVVDVSDATLTDVLVGQIRDDVVAATAEPRLARSHSYARARLVPTATALAQGGALLLPRPTITRPDVESAAAVILLERLRTTSRESGDALGGVGVDVVASPVPAPVTLGEAAERRLVRLLPGNRQGFDLREDGTVPVLGVPELTRDEARGSRRVDRLTFLGTYDVARLTEPGDVVFCTSPRPRAAVDETGGSAVQYPARVLRVDPVRGEGLVSRLVASAINAQPARSRAWRSWSLPRVPAGQVIPLGTALAALDHAKAATRARLVELDELHHTLVQGVTSGSFALTSTAHSSHDKQKDN